MDSDPERIELKAPLPDGALSARVTFKAARLGIDRTVPRSQATHADIERERLNGKSDSERLEKTEVEAYLAEVARFHAEVERDDAAHRERVEAKREERELVARTLTVDCPHCGIPRTFEGRRDILSSGAPENVSVTGDFLGSLRMAARAYYEYACPRCGSVEFFRHGPAEHPIGGQAPG